MTADPPPAFSFLLWVSFDLGRRRQFAAQIRESCRRLADFTRGTRSGRNSMLNQELITEELAGVFWPKVMRGAMRIYLRETAEGILFHLIQRRDREKACVVERTFAHA